MGLCMQGALLNLSKYKLIINKKNLNTILTISYFISQFILLGIFVLVIILFVYLYELKQMKYFYY
jgi:hypothetical protein